jgi:hypothetical protein
VKSEWTTELEIAIAAKNGDKAALEALWLKYRKPMANIFYRIFAMPEERESEAAEIFMHCIKTFNPERDENRREGWRLFSYLYFSMAARRSKLRRRPVHLSYDESAEAEDGDGALNAEMVCLFNRDLFLRYNPESIITEEPRKKVDATIGRIEDIKANYFRHIQEMIGL